MRLAPNRAGLALLLALGCRGPAEADEPRTAPEVVIDQGRLRGIRDGPTEVFRGIPYAAPPIGARRFRAPEPPLAWPEHEVRDATRFGSVCPQLGPAEIPIGDEDCLTLNVWRPSTPTTTEPLPVMVFIHGGANVIGSGSHPHHDGQRLAHDHELVVVTFNYRLGLLGFLAHPGLTRESGSSGNWAHLDQIAALEWVADNIAAFGGDPDRVTLFGQSAGGSSVCVLLASPLATGLFDAAIVQSGGCDVATLAQREAEGERLVAAACEPSEDPLACLRARSAEQLVRLAPAPSEGLFDWALPVGGAVDGLVLPVSPWDAFAAKTHNVVPTMVGSNAHETQLLLEPMTSECSVYAREVVERFGDAAADVLAQYPCTSDERGRQTLVEVTTDMAFTCPARRLLQRLAPAGAPLFRYRYDYTRADPAVRSLRAAHGGELQLLFGTWRRFGHDHDRDRAMAATLAASWAGLATRGTPVHAGTPNWRPYEVEREPTVLFDVPSVGVDGVDERARCQLWDRLWAEQRQSNR